MQIHSIQPVPIEAPQPTFEGKHQLKSLWRAGKLPSVKYGLYGGRLEQDTLSIEHVKPRSQGGSNDISNVALSTKANNNARGVKPLSEVLTFEMYEKYAKQFLDIRIKGFNGFSYIKELTKNIVRIFAKEGKRFLPEKH